MAPINQIATYSTKLKTTFPFQKETIFHSEKGTSAFPILSPGRPGHDQRASNQLSFEKLL
jgi:hypothetical protein